MHETIEDILLGNKLRNSPEDITESGMEELLREQRRYVLVSGSSIILMSK